MIQDEQRFAVQLRSSILDRLLSSLVGNSMRLPSAASTGSLSSLNRQYSQRRLNRVPIISGDSLITFIPEIGDLDQQHDAIMSVADRFFQRRAQSDVDHEGSQGASSFMRAASRVLSIYGKSRKENGTLTQCSHPNVSSRCSRDGAFRL
jgi:hypothetical protein